MFRSKKRGRQSTGAAGKSDSSKKAKTEKLPERAAPKQRLAHVAADEAAAAEDGHQGWAIEWAHVLLSGCLTGGC